MWMVAGAVREGEGSIVANVVTAGNVKTAVFLVI
jgi:hypothetical protein